MILFLSRYPQTDTEFRDGFFQRVASIDQFFLDDERVYLCISPFKNWKKKISKNGLRVEISCNFFMHFFLIISLFNKASLVYIQSIYNALYAIFFICIFKKYYVLDLHGVVPEELEMQNKKLHTFIFSKIEKILFKKVNVCVAVTNKMVKHYELKYSNSNCFYIVYAILPSHLKNIHYDFNENESVEIIYSGNMQSWQNIDLMLDAIKLNLGRKINFTILTGELENFTKLLEKYQIDKDSITMRSVKPNELARYYKKSNYGFILRDDILVNTVACPTKIIEYLSFGIIPIVLSPKIGDFEDLGYEYISINQLHDNLEIKKSLKNIEVSKNIFENNNYDFKRKIINLQKNNII